MTVAARSWKLLVILCSPFIQPPARRWSCWPAPLPPPPGGTGQTAAPTVYRSSLRASSSALIAEISASTASACSPRRR